jgi:hypothetical protein
VARRLQVLYQYERFLKEQFQRFAAPSGDGDMDLCAFLLLCKVRRPRVPT